MSFRDDHQKAEAAKEKLSAQDQADVAKVAKLFNTPDGQEVLALLCRRFGVLGRRFRPNAKGEIDPVLAAVNDGQAGAVLFLLKCLKDAGTTTITLEL